MLKHDIGFFKASDSIHLNPYESQLSSASDKYNPSYPRLLMLNLNVIFSFCREINGEKKKFCLVTNPRKKLKYRMFTEVES